MSCWRPNVSLRTYIHWHVATEHLPYPTGLLEISTTFPPCTFFRRQQHELLKLLSSRCLSSELHETLRKPAYDYGTHEPAQYKKTETSCVGGLAIVQASRSPGQVGGRRSLGQKLIEERHTHFPPFVSLVGVFGVFLLSSFSWFRNSLNYH
jgi:hypothetical protein